MGRNGPQTIDFTPHGFVVQEAGQVYPVRFVDASLTVRLEGREPQGAYTSYFSADGNVPGVPHFGQVVYVGLYPGIDAIFYIASDGLVEFDYVVQPGADAQQVRLAPGDGARLDPQADGTLHVITAEGHLPLLAPVVYQEGSGGREPVEARYEAGPDGFVAFRLGEHDAGRELVIDPKLGFSSFVGGTAADVFHSVSSSYEGGVWYVYATGAFASSAATRCASSAPGALAACPTAFGSTAATGGAVAKFRMDLDGGASLQWMAVLTSATPYDIDVDATGVYVAGMAIPNLPVTANAYQSAVKLNPDGAVCSGRPYNDAFLSVLSHNGQDLTYSTYIGGMAGDYAHGVAAGNGRPVITGATQWISKDRVGFPVLNAIQYEHAGPPFLSGTFCAAGGLMGGMDAFVARFDPSIPAGPGTLVFSTYLGGGLPAGSTTAASGQDYGRAVAVDANDDVWVTGSTNSASSAVPPFPTTVDALQPGAGGAGDAYLVKILGIGGALLYGSFLGGSGLDDGRALLVQGTDVLVAGGTASGNFPVNGPAYQTAGAGGKDAFVSRFDMAMAPALSKTTLVGTAGDQEANTLLLDDTGDIHVAGWTTRGDLFPRLHAWPGLDGGANTDYFAARLSPDLLTLRFSTAVGSIAAEVPGNGRHAALVGASGLAAANDIVLAGVSSSPTWPIATSASDPRIALPPLQSFHRVASGANEGVLARFTTPSEPFVACGAIGQFYRGIPLTFTWAPLDLPHTQGIETYDALAATDPDYGMDIATFRWDFDYDGSTFVPDPAADGQAEPVHTYPSTAALGLRTIMLEARDTDGRLGSATCTVELANQLPHAVCTILTPGPHLVHQNIQLSSAGSFDPDGAIASYAWSLAPDGAFVAPATSSSENPTIRFPTAGDKTVMLTVTDENGGSDVPLRSVAYSAGAWVAVGVDGAVYQSVDGTEWDPVASGTPRSLHGVAYGGGVWIAVGEGGTILSSPDGLAWTAEASGVFQDLNAVTFDGTLFVAVGAGGKILSSPTGSTWTERATGTGALHGVGHATTGTIRWVAVGAGGLVRTSPDGVAWTTRTSNTAAPLHDVMFQDGRWIAVGTGSSMIHSRDGITWAPIMVNGLASAGGGWVAVGTAGVVLASSDGQQWTVGATGSTESVNAVAMDGSTLVAVDSQSRLRRSSDGGNTWTTTSGSGGEALHGVVYTTGSHATRWVAVGGGGRIWYSTAAGATTWSSTTIGSADLYAVAYGSPGGTANHWLATGKDGSMRSTSNPGSGWTQWNFPGTTDYFGAAYGIGPPGTARWVVVGENGAIRYSTTTGAPNGVGWNAGSVVGNPILGTLRSVHHDGTAWTAVGDEGVILASDDGITWDLQPSVTDADLRAIASDGASVIAMGTGGVVVSSPVTAPDWSLRMSGVEGDLRGLASDGAGMSAVVGSAGAASGNGVLWDMSPSGAGLWGVAHGGGQFVAVGDASHTQTSMDGAEWTPVSSGATAICPLTVVMPDLMATINGELAHVASGTVDIPLPLTPNVLGGAAPLTCTWSVTPATGTVTGLSDCVTTAIFLATIAGSYTVTLEATDQGGDTATATATVTVSGPLGAQLSPENGAGISTTAFALTPTAGGGTEPYACTWSISPTGGLFTPPGEPCTDDATFVSGIAGNTYTVTFTVQDADGTVATATSVLAIHADVTASLAVHPESAYANPEALFVFPPNVQGGVPPIQCTWSLLPADGSFLEPDLQPCASPATFTGGTAGQTYTVVLQATDALGETAVASKVVEVRPNIPPHADFHAEGSARDGDFVTFVDGSTDEDGAIVSHQWQFGDGATSNLRSPMHAFAAPGTYWVSLTVMDNSGATATKVQSVVVGPFGQEPGGTPMGEQSASGGAMAPLANAGQDQTVGPGVQVHLAGSALGPQALGYTYTWRQTAGPIVRLMNASSASPWFEAPELPGGEAVVLQFSLVVSHGSATSEPSFVHVIVSSLNRAPLAHAGEPFAVESNSLVGLDAGASHDPDGDPLAFRWKQEGGPVVELRDADSANPSFVAPGTGEVRFVLEVSDGNSTATDSIVVWILPARVDEVPAAAAPLVPESLEDGQTVRASTGPWFALLALGLAATLMGIAAWRHARRR